ncbi:MAG: inorganic phosphate transporter [Rhodothermales bacterium]
MAVYLVSVVLATAFLAYANGANDNFKGVATLYGSGTLGYKAALTWATVTTLAGSVVSIYFAELLVSRFSGKGLLPDAVIEAPEFMLSVSLGAGITVIMASRAGLPISTTHSLTGALVGAGFVSVGSDLRLSVLGYAFVMPLLVSPFLAAGLSATGYYGVVRVMKGSVRTGWRTRPTGFEGAGGKRTGHMLDTSTLPEEAKLNEIPRAWTINMMRLRDKGHVLSGGIVSFARGLNDTPKIVALLLAVEAMEIAYGMLIVATAMAFGGVLHSRRVAEVMSRGITRIEPTKGLGANLVTGLLVIVASRLGLPVSTTHVSVGSIVGNGLISRDARWSAVGQIALSWLLTLPAAAISSALVYGMLT